jgi:phosphoribosylanthranilate isomerase
MLRIKICGITNYDDAAMAADLGADAVGFIFASSSRQTDPDSARKIISRLPPFIKSVGVFVNEDTKKIIDIAEYCGLDNIQLHGSESPEACEILMPLTIKALRIKSGGTPEEYSRYTGKVKAFLLDTYSEKEAGGTGKTFNWDIAVNIKSLGVPIILAGGLNPENIKEAIDKVKPYAVDIGSGIEERPGKKDHLLMRNLFERIRG